MIPVELVNYWFTPFPGRFESDDTVYASKGWDFESLQARQLFR
jgi:hypothetical protein